jgi:hypothetical protein
VHCSTLVPVPRAPTCTQHSIMHQVPTHPAARPQNTLLLLPAAKKKATTTAPTPPIELDPDLDALCCCAVLCCGLVPGIGFAAGGWGGGGGGGAASQRAQIRLRVVWAQARARVHRPEPGCMAVHAADGAQAVGRCAQITHWSNWASSEVGCCAAAVGNTATLLHQCALVLSGPPACRALLFSSSPCALCAVPLKHAPV